MLVVVVAKRVAALWLLSIGACLCPCLSAPPLCLRLCDDKEWGVEVEGWTAAVSGLSMGGGGGGGIIIEKEPLVL